MRGNNPAWLVVLSEDDHVPRGVLCGRLIRRTKTVATIIAIVYPTVDKDALLHLQTAFDFVIFAEQPSVHEHLESRVDALLLQALKFLGFSKIVIVHPSVMMLHPSDHLLDSYDVLLNNEGNWKVVAVRPNASKWKTMRDVVVSSDRKMDTGTFINLLQTQFGGNVKHLDFLDPNCVAGNRIVFDVEINGWKDEQLREYLGRYDIELDIKGALSSAAPKQDEVGQDAKGWIAVVGMSCRFPGADSVEEYWEILKNGVNTSSPPSEHRALLSNLGANVQANYLKCPIDKFDAQFFGMAPTEAILTDVQARLLLEVSWEAFEDAGVNVDKLRGSPTGIFHGSWIQDYKECLNNVSPSDQEFIRKYIGNSFGSTAAKLSFFYGLTGPNIATDSGCSSSMIAVELACKSLIEGECPLAVATGSNIILQYDTMSKVVWAEDGICKTFDASANGYGRAEGIAALVLKRYSDAIRSNDRIHGIIRGSASTQEGLSRSFGTPTVESEALAMKNALSKSGLNPEDVDYVEAHATGTGVGDPIEAAAIVKAYSSASRKTPLLIGSGKTNIGHTESCSGLAGLMKVLLALKHELIPPHINLTQLNPKINFEQIPGTICVQATPWARSSIRQRIAGVSNFGITGTDVHMIIQEGPKPQEQEKLLTGKKQGPPIHLVAISAKTDAALEQLTNYYSDLLQSPQAENDTLGNIAFTANARRTHHSSSRKVGIGRNKNELIESFKKARKSFPDLKPEALKICFFFCNEFLDNSVVRNYYSGLYSSSLFFKNRMDKCDQICRKFANLSPSDVLTAKVLDFNKMSELRRNLCSFSVAYSLSKLWESWGVNADLIIGHGIGELAGRVTAGLLTLLEAIQLIGTSTSEENLLKIMKNQRVTGSIPYIAHEGGNLDSKSIWTQATQNGCQFCIQIGYQEPILNDNNALQIDANVLNASERSWLPLVTNLGSLYEAGYNVDWDGFYECYQPHFTLASLPHYPFQRKAYWFPKEKLTRVEKRLEQPQLHPLLGELFNTASKTSSEEIYQNWLTASPSKAPFLKDHVIGNEVIFPAAAYLEMVLAAHDVEFGGQSPIVIENFVVHRPLLLQSGNHRTIQTIASSSAGISIYSSEGMARNKKERNWKMYASAHFATNKMIDSSFEHQVDVEILKNGVLDKDNSSDMFYNGLENVGLQFGPRFKSLQTILQREGETLGQISNIPEAELGDYICHPLLIDAMLQCFLFAKEPLPTTLQVPVSIQKFVWFSRPSSAVGGSFYVYCNSHTETVYLLDSKNNVIAIMYEPVLKKTSVASVLNAAGLNNTSLEELAEPAKFEIHWKPSPTRQQPDSCMALKETRDFTDTPNFNGLLQYFGERNRFTRREKELDENINRLISLYVINALFELGWQPSLKESIDEIAVKLKVAPALVPTFRQLFTQFFSETPNKSASETKREIDQILRDVSHYPAIQAVIQPCGSQLAQLLTGEELHFGDAKKLLEFYYETGRFLSRKVSSQILKEVAKEMWKREGCREAGKIMRILEIGTGAPTFVTEVLPGLDEHDIEYEYWLTSSSSEGLELTAAKLSMHKNHLVWRKLDIRKDPIEQGFSPAYFDIVVVLNGIESTQNCRESWGNLRQLAKVGGMLIIEEMNGWIPELDIVFGVLEGYWHHKDFEDRPNHVGVDQLARLMEEEDFHPVHKILHSGSNMRVLVGQLKSSSQLETKERMRITMKKLRPYWLLVCDEDLILEENIRQRMMTLGRDLVIRHFHEVEINFVDDVLKNMEESLEGILFIVEEDIGMEAPAYRIYLEPLLQASKCLIKFPWTRSMPKLIVATKGCSPVAATLWGFVRTAQFEIAGLESKLIDLDPNVEVEERLHLLFHEIWMAGDDEETEIQYRSRVRSARRLRKSNIGLGASPLSIPNSETGDYSVELPASNLISDLTYSARTVETPLSADEVEIRVQSVSLNFRDVLNVLKPTPEFEKLNTLGLDFSGVITAVGAHIHGKWRVGDSVFGFAKQQTVVTGLLRYSSRVLARVPKNVGFSEAATLPAAFLTAWHCIVNVAQAQPGQTILIHAASGGVGLTAIQVAKYLGLNIIGTAGSERKRKYLRNLGLQHVFGSRTLEFGRQTMEVTNGQGVDLVLNCLTGPGFKETSLEVCKDGGYFVEISKLDIWERSEVEKMRPKVCYEIVYITELEDSLLKKMLDQLTVLVEEGSIHPIPFTPFSASRIVHALTFLQKAKQIGKVVVEMPSFDNPRKELREQLFNTQSSYLITGGKGVISLAIAKWMVKQGAKYFVLLGRSPPTDKALENIQTLEENGAKIICIEADISNYDQCKKVLQDIETSYNLPPLRGVHHCAGLLSDKTIIHQEWEDFEHVLAPKAKGAYNLHQLTEKNPLQFFVVHSSMAATLGNAGQSNYTAANAYMEALIEMRHGMGLTGLCVSWGHWNAGLGENLELKVAHPFTARQGIQALEQMFLENKEQPCVVVGSINTKELVKLRPPYEKTLLEGIVKDEERDDTNQDGRDVVENKPNFLETYGKAEGFEEKELAIQSLVKELIADTLGVELQEIEQNTLFVIMGMDSLLSIEFYNKLQTQVGQTKLGFLDMEEYGTVDKLSQFIKTLLDSNP